MKNLYLIPTDKPSRLLKTMPKGNLILSKSITSGSHWENQNIYTTSNEEIKMDDWYLDDTNSVRQAITECESYWTHRKKYQKIILTTDPKLIEDGVQAIDDEFLEWFVNNLSCEEVKVRKNPKVHFIVKGKGVKGFNQGYKIIIPKEEHILEEAKQRAKNYMSLKGALDSQYVDFSNPNADKITSASTTTIKEEPKQGLNLSLLEQKLDEALSNETEESLNTWLKEKRDKQETLEEVKDINYWKNNCEENYITTPISVLRYISELEKQQERMYSEEDMRLAIKKARDISDGKECFDAEDVSGCTEVCTYGWKFNMSEDLIIEQFKKK